MHPQQSRIVAAREHRTFAYAERPAVRRGARHTWQQQRIQQRQMTSRPCSGAHQHALA